MVINGHLKQSSPNQFFDPMVALAPREESPRRVPAKMQWFPSVAPSRSTTGYGMVGNGLFHPLKSCLENPMFSMVNSTDPFLSIF